LCLCGFLLYRSSDLKSSLQTAFSIGTQVAAYYKYLVLTDNVFKEEGKPQRHKEHKGLEVLSIFVAASEEEIKKMDRIVGSTERVCYPSF
jgi:hypothetical protein